MVAHCSIDARIAVGRGWTRENRWRRQLKESPHESRARVHVFLAESPGGGISSPAALCTRLSHVAHSPIAHCLLRQSNAHISISSGTSWATWSRTHCQHRTRGFLLRERSGARGIRNWGLSILGSQDSEILSQNRPSRQVVCQPGSSASRTHPPASPLVFGFGSASTVYNPFFALKFAARHPHDGINAPCRHPSSLTHPNSSLSKYILAGYGRPLWAIVEAGFSRACR